MLHYGWGWGKYCPPMPVRLAARHVAAILGYLCVALAFAWPLPLHLATMLPGSIGGDTGV